MTDRQFLKEFRKQVPKEIFRKTPLQLFWMPVCLLLITVGVYLFRSDSLAQWVVGSVILGYAYATMAFLFHDLRHQAIVENPILVDILSRILIWPCLVSQTFWDFWHNDLHHRHHLIENRALKEYPTESFLKGTWLQGFIQKISPPERGLLGFFYLFFWYVPFIVLVQTLLLIQSARFKRLSRKKVLLDIVVAVFIWSVFIKLAAPQNTWVFLLGSYFVQSFMLSSFVVTNHHPRLVGEDGKMVLSTCSIKGSSVFNFLTLHFGLHTEHHLLPDVSPSQLPRVTQILRKEYDGKYCEMGFWQALKKIYF